MYASLKKIFFLIGASRSGKTTATKELERRGLANFKILYFDSIGVPSIEEMEIKYGGPEEWQKIKTIEWVKVIKRDFLPDTHVLFDGQTRPSFIENACHKSGIKEFEVVLFDRSDEERRRRLLSLTLLGLKTLIINTPVFKKYLNCHYTTRRNSIPFLQDV